MSNASQIESNNPSQYYFDANNNLTENKPAPTSRMQYGSAGAVVTTTSSPSSSVTPPPSYGETRQSTPAETNEYNILPQMDSARDIEMRGMRNRTDGNSSGRNVFEISYL